MRAATALLLLLFAAFATAAQQNPVVALNLHFENSLADSSQWSHSVEAITSDGFEPTQLAYSSDCTIGSCAVFTGEEEGSEFLRTDLSGIGAVPASATGSPATISLWLSVDAGAQANDMMVFGPDIGDGAYRGAVIIDTGKVMVRDGQGGPSELFTIPGEYATTMHMLTVVYDGAGAAGYWDGAPMGIAPGVQLDLNEAGTTLSIGGGRYSNAWSGPFKGRIDEFHALSTAITSSQVKHLYQLEHRSSTHAEIAEIIIEKIKEREDRAKPTPKVEKPRVTPRPTPEPRRPPSWRDGRRYWKELPHLGPFTGDVIAAFLFSGPVGFLIPAYESSV